MPVAKKKPSASKRIPKTEVILVIQGNYGYGWDDVSAYPENQHAQARADLREYRASGQGSHRMIRRRVDRVTQEPVRRATRSNGYDLSLSAEQLSALRRYADRHGRAWKAALRADWMRASAPAALQRLRNTHGPSWLTSFRLPASGGMVRPNPQVECRDPKSKFDRYRGAKVMHQGEWLQLEGCYSGSRYVGRAEGAKKRTTISKQVVRQKASRTPSRVKGARARRKS